MHFALHLRSYIKWMMNKWPCKAGIYYVSTRYNCTTQINKMAEIKFTQCLLSVEKKYCFYSGRARPKNWTGTNLLWICRARARSETCARVRLYLGITCLLIPVIIHRSVKFNIINWNQTTFRHAQVKCKKKQGCYTDIWPTLTSIFQITTSQTDSPFCSPPHLTSVLIPL